MFSCEQCNLNFKRNCDYSRHCNTIRHNKRVTELSTKKAVAAAAEEEKAAAVAAAEEEKAAAAVEEPPPDVSLDAIINLFRFTREHYTNLPEKGIIKTCVELLTEKLKQNTICPFIFHKDSNSISLYYRGNWVTEKVNDIIYYIETRNEDERQETPILCELIDMFIENMMIQFRRDQELHNYHSISREIENGYRSNVQIKIIKNLAKS